MQVRNALIAGLLILCGGCDGLSTGSSSTKPGSKVSVATPVQALNPFPAATEVRLFVVTGYDGDGWNIYGRPEGKILSAGQRSDLEASLMVVPMPDEMAACFIPHHFFRYYDKSGKQIGEIEVCFCCLGLEISRPSKIEMGSRQMLSADYKRLEALVRSMGEPTDVNCE